MGPVKDVFAADRRHRHELTAVLGTVEQFKLLFERPPLLPTRPRYNAFIDQLDSIPSLRCSACHWCLLHTSR
ncbi:hypothetical protein GALL_322680 [mine drainage metagenome]|jgi:hypothetical protein|uniref:Uncharacterized protein n=1 Tax=mine drainage metagenome TaxID=410659 RepID=A0A1J5R841_9ZZZZ